MIFDKGGPFLRFVGIGGSFNITEDSLDSAYRESNVQFAELALNSWNTPGEIVRIHGSDELADFRCNA